MTSPHPAHQEQKKAGMLFRDKAILLAVYFLFVLGADHIVSLLARLRVPFLERGIFSMYPVYVLILFIAAFLTIKCIDRKPFSHYGFRRFSLREAWLMLCFVFFLMPLAFLGRIVDPSFDAWYAGNTGMYTLTGFLVFSAIMPLFVLKEELIERALFQTKLRQAYPFFIVLIALSVNFGLAHFSSAQGFALTHTAVQAGSVIFGSLVLVLFFAITRNIWLSFLLHLIYNVVISLQIYLHVARPVWEGIFWLAAGGLFLATLRPVIRASIPLLRPKERVRIPFGEWVFLAVFAVALPVLLILLR